MAILLKIIVSKPELLILIIPILTVLSYHILERLSNFTGKKSIFNVLNNATYGFKNPIISATKKNEIANTTSISKTERPIVQ